MNPDCFIGTNRRVAFRVFFAGYLSCVNLKGAGRCQVGCFTDGFIREGVHTTLECVEQFSDGTTLKRAAVSFVGSQL